jgi:sugar phosphate isomerase/epimerase
MLWMLGAITSMDVGICLDTGHAFLSGDLDTVIHKLSGHLWMVHASDNHGERDDHLAPGRGRIYWRSVIDKLAQTQFAGDIIIEMAADASGNVDLAAAQQARTFLHELAGELEVARRLGG